MGSGPEKSKVSSPQGQFPDAVSHQSPDSILDPIPVETRSINDPQSPAAAPTPHHSAPRRSAPRPPDTL